MRDFKIIKMSQPVILVINLRRDETLATLEFDTSLELGD